MMTNPETPFLTCPVTHKTPRDHPIDLFGDSCFHVDSSGARTTDWPARPPTGRLAAQTAHNIRRRTP